MGGAPIKRSAVCLLGVFVVAAAAQQALAVVTTVDTFGPNFGYLNGTGVTPMSTTWYYEYANGFTALETGRVCDIWAPLGTLSGTPTLDIMLLDQVGGAPGAELGRWTVTFPSGMDHLVHLEVEDGPMLSAGDYYYFAVAPTAGAYTYGLWNLTSLTGYPSADRWYRDATSGPWTSVAPSNPLVAFRADVLPEPATLALVGLGLAGLAARRKR